MIDDTFAQSKTRSAKSNSTSVGDETAQGEVEHGHCRRAEAEAPAPGTAFIIEVF